MLNQTLTVFDGETENYNTLKATVDINSAYDRHGCLMKLEGTIITHAYEADPADALARTVTELDAVIQLLQDARARAVALHTEWATDERQAAYLQASRDARLYP